MTSAQTLSTHSSFNTKQKSSLLSEDSEHEYSTSKPIPELETLTKLVSQANLRNSSASRMSLRSREQGDQGSIKTSMVPTSENSRKSETSPQASSDNTLQAKNKLNPSKLAAKLDENNLVKSPGANDLPRPRRGSEDNFTYNTRKHNKAVEHPMEIEDSKAQNDKKNTPTDSVSNQQIGGYHLRSTGPKSGNRDSGFSDDFEYEYPGKNPSGSEGGNANYASSRSKTTRGTASTYSDNVGQTNQEPATQKAGSGQKNSVSRRTRQPNVQNMICDEDISHMEVSSDVPEKRRTTERIPRSKRDMDKVFLECTEELEDPRSNDLIENNLRSPQASRGDNNRKRGGKKCLNKLCLTNPNMPSLWAREKVKGSAICKACLDAFNKDQFCYFCHQIYVDDETTTAIDDKDWIGCDSCGGWHHIQCEDAYGTKIVSQHAKYFCPKCRPTKGAQRNSRVSNMAFLEIPATTSRGNNSPRNSQPGTPRKGQNGGKNNNPRPPLDDWLTCEEGLEEPPVTKMRFNNDRRGTNVEVSAASGEDDSQVIEEEEEDLVKKKLDALFRRNSSRRRTQLKPQVVVESFGELDKLLTTFGGKRSQLADQEIKSDLAKIKELTKGLIGLPLLSEASGSEICATEGDMTEETESVADTPVLKNNGRTSRNARGGAASRTKERVISQTLIVKESTTRTQRQVNAKSFSQEVSMGSETLPKMSLRRR